MIAPFGFTETKPSNGISDKELQQISTYLWKIDGQVLREARPYIELLVEIIVGIVPPDERDPVHEITRLLTENGMTYPVFRGCQRIICNSLKEPDTSPLNLEGLRYALESLIFIRLAEEAGTCAGAERPLVQKVIMNILLLTAAAVICLRLNHSESCTCSYNDVNTMYHQLLEEVSLAIEKLREIL